MTGRYIRLESLWIHPGQEAAFDAFESEAAQIMARYGGRIERALRTFGQGADVPFEMHLVSFPDVAASDSFAGDLDALALRASREKIIARTEVVEVEDVGPY